MKQRHTELFFVFVALCFVSFRPVVGVGGQNGKRDCNLVVSPSGTDSKVCGWLRTSPCATIQQAVLNARENNTICIEGGANISYSCSSEVGGVVINKSLTLRAMRSEAVIDCKRKGRAFWITNPAAQVTLLGLEMRNGVAFSTGGGGGAIHAASTTLARVTLKNCSFFDNSATDNGGAVHLVGVEALILDSYFKDNRVVPTGQNEVQGGALYVSSSRIEVRGSTFEGNTAPWIGGAVGVITSLRVNFTDNHFYNNTAKGADGGAMFLSFGGGVIVGNRFIGNTAGLNGGGICMEPSLPPNASSSFNVTLHNNTFLSNDAAMWGGGVCVFAMGYVTHKPGNTTTWHRTTAVFEGNQMIGNSASFGGALMVWYPLFAEYEGEETANNAFHFRGETFDNNTAREHNGGAVSIWFPAEKVNSSYSNPVPGEGGLHNRTWTYTKDQSFFENCNFTNNRAASKTGMGGALHIECGRTSVKGCLFQSNRAGFFGGAIAETGSSTALQVEDSTFVGNSAFAGGGDIYSFAGGDQVVDARFRVTGSNASLFELPQGGYVDFYRSSVTCSIGSQLNGRMLTYPMDLMPWGFVAITTMTLSCIPCEVGKYSLDGGTLIDGAWHEGTCHMCLDETDCSGGGSNVQTLPGYWCYPSQADPSALDCMRCPEGYCIEDSPTPWNASCAEHRVGPLCGMCEKGFSEAFGTTGCVDDDQCSSDGWFVPTLLATSFVYVGIVLWLPIGRHPLWKSVVYFFQIAPLLIGSKDRLVQAIFAVFALDPSILGVRVSVCPFVGLTAVQKMLSNYLWPMVLLATLCMTLAAHALVNCIRSILAKKLERLHEEGGEWESSMQDPSDQPEALEEDDMEIISRNEEEQDASPYSRYAAALVSLMLLLYEGITSGTFEMLNCVPVGAGLRLFRAGDTRCYAAWQIPLFLLLGMFLVPFPLLLLLFRHCIHRWHSKSSYGVKVLAVLERPYASNRKWWESFGMLRRLVLISIAVLIINPIWRAISLSLVCLGVLLSHIYFTPFADKPYNAIDTAFLAGLVVLSALQGPQAAYAHLGKRLEENTRMALEGITALVTLSPLLLCTLLFIWKAGPTLYAWIGTRTRAWMQRWHKNTACIQHERTPLRTT